MGVPFSSSSSSKCEKRRSLVVGSSSASLSSSFSVGEDELEKTEGGWYVMGRICWDGILLFQGSFLERENWQQILSFLCLL